LANKKTLKLPSIIAENYENHQFGKASVKSDQARKLIINEFNREYIENQQVRQANYQIELIKSKMKNKNQNNKVQQLRSLSVAK